MLAYLAVVLVALAASAALGLPGMLRSVEESYQHPSLDSLARVLSGVPVATAAVVVLSIVAHALFRASGVAWHAFAFSMASAAAWPIACWQSYALEGTGSGTWVTAVSGAALLLPPFGVPASLLWLIVRRVGRVDVPPSIQSGTDTWHHL
ncbi:hypothetical protein [uncultured Microbacterium sp.]|uniref:hypothetical protein n=1 Tax=uncultured Microbacterium sp. TaxID=191216 RepID=UPI0028DC9819|nr:hypothetical protein [uncultured Microbacterium sp.]